MMLVKRVYHTWKSYILYFLWSSFKRSSGLSFTVTTSLFFLHSWLTIFVLEPGHEMVMVVEQLNFTTMVVIPYSFWKLFKTREKEG